MGSRITACIGLLLLAACDTPSGSTAGDARAELRRADAELQKAVAARDAEAVIGFYADDAVLMPTAEPIIVGRAGIREEWEHIFAIPSFENNARLTGVDVSASADLGYTRGTYVSRMEGETGGMIEEPGKWLTVWRKQSDGRWRVAVDTYNTDIPPPDHK